MNLIESLWGPFTPDVILRAGRSLGEPASAIHRGLTGALATVLAGVTKVASADEGDALARLLKQHAAEPALLDHLTGLFAGAGIAPTIANKGQQAVGEIFGPGAGGFGSALASFAGIKISSARYLLAVSASVVLGFLSRHQISQALSAAGLAKQLSSQRDSLMPLLPPGVSNALGFLPSIETAATPELASRRAAAEGNNQARSRYRWLPALSVFAVFAVGSLLLIPRTCSHGVRNPGQDAFANITLPDGTVVRLQPNSFNYNLASFIGKSSPQDPPRTFVLDTLKFESGSTRITPESEPTIQALAAILRGSPNTAVVLGGHADHAGSGDATRDLMLERANSVRERLLSNGVEPTHVAAVNYGKEPPIAPNDTQEGRAGDRQLELTVIRK